MTRGISACCAETETRASRSKRGASLTVSVCTSRGSRPPTCTSWPSQVAACKLAELVTARDNGAEFNFFKDDCIIIFGSFTPRIHDQLSKHTSRPYSYLQVSRFWRFILGCMIVLGRVSRREIVDGLPRPSEAPALVVELAVALLVVASHALYSRRATEQTSCQRRRRQERSLAR